jgi:DtxR family Mn-dependent transcriptional regulator
VAGTEKPELTRSAEDYLKAILQLEGATGAAHTRAIARALTVAPPSVSGMVRRLTASGLLQHAPYRGVRLTATGRRAALRMVRRHRVLETYLAAKLGYAWDSVHDEAERLEHTVSDELVERMAMALGNPRYDPHGAPIPTALGEMEEVEHVTVADVPVGGVAELRMVSDQDPGLLRHVAFLGLRPGVSFEVVARQPFRGPVTLRILGGAPREQVIGHELAASLYCRVLPKEAG